MLFSYSSFSKSKNHIKSVCAFILLTIIFLSINTVVFANSDISTVQITTATLAAFPNCSHYRIVGLCFWQDEWYESPTSTLKLDQYVPDVAITVYHNHEDNPWDYPHLFIDPGAYKLGEVQLHHYTGVDLGYGHQSQNSQRDIDNHFHEVDIIGNPALIFLNRLGIILTSAATPFAYYYSSLADAYAWRFPLLEKLYPGSLVPGLHEVGTLLLHDWGPVYPRNGFVTQPDDAKAAAVIAHRAADIVTHFGQPHLYYSLSNSCGDHCDIQYFKENNDDAQFQMVYPIEEHECMVFGNSDITSPQPWGTEAAQKGDGRYVWILWRHYHGCVQGDGDYIGSIDF